MSHEENVQRVAAGIKAHPWYENEPMEKCREMAEKQLAQLEKLAAQNIRSKVDKINEIMRNNWLHGEVYDESDNVVAVKINWGDWKHDHLRLKWLVEKAMPEIKSVTSVTTEEDGSDCYSAIHRFYF